MFPLFSDTSQNSADTHCQRPYKCAFSPFSQDSWPCLLRVALLPPQAEPFGTRHNVLGAVLGYRCLFCRHSLDTAAWESVASEMTADHNIFWPTGLILLWLCYLLNICVPPYLNSYVEAQSSMWWNLEVGPLGGN